MSESVVCSRIGSLCRRTVVSSLADPRAARLGVLVGLLLVGCGASTAPMCAGDRCLDASRPGGGSADLDGALGSPDAGKPAAPRADAAMRDAADVAPPGPDDLPCDVKRIVGTYCGDCHGVQPDFGAPMSLVSSANFHALRKGMDWMLPLIEARFNATDHEIIMPPGMAPQPDAAERALLNRWLAAGALGQAQPCSASASHDGGRDD